VENKGTQVFAEADEVAVELTVLEVRVSNKLARLLSSVVVPTATIVNDDDEDADMDAVEVDGWTTIGSDVVDPGIAVEDDPGTAVEDDEGIAVEDDPGTAVEDDEGTAVEDDPGTSVEDDEGTAVENEDKVEKYVEAKVSTIVFDSSVTVTKLSVVAIGSSSSKRVEVIGSVTVSEAPVIVVSVVSVPVGTRHTIVPFWSSMIESMLSVPPVIQKWLHTVESWPVQSHNKNASPLGTSAGTLNSAICRPPRHVNELKPKYICGKDWFENLSVASQRLPDKEPSILHRY
jgi:hypothetical protein